jgi:hypothetical protein
MNKFPVRGGALGTFNSAPPLGLSLDLSLPFATSREESWAVHRTEQTE